ncbi:MAG TPA: recombinase family protein [Gemmatimonadales bacterium]|nr:recombinase family protein [Gemmatimonadales bacterium]
MIDQPSTSARSGSRLPEKAVPVATYARYSTNRQDARSIDDQLRRCHAHAGQRGFQVIADYADAAVSGSHTDRNNLRRLLADARAGSIRHVLVDDLSRLSRDLGDAWRLIYSEFASVDVSVIDCTTGMASDAAGARVTFGALALANDTFLQLVRTETHRGLEGRALAGFATGGKTFGYATKPEENPRDPEHPRKITIVDQAEAKVVLRIFSDYAEGRSAQHIASALNEEGLPAPHDNGRGNKGLRGWSHTTIREMLRNERYIGVLRWNERKWVRTPGKKSRRAIMRPEHEHIVRELPELAIVPRELWDRVRDRFRKFARPNGGRPPGRVKKGHPVSLLSGLLRCGICGGSMSIVQRTHKKGTSYAFLGCLTYRSRGPAICANRRMLSEKKVREAVLGLLQEQLRSPGLVPAFIASFEQRHRELEKDDASTDLERQLSEAEQKVRNMTEILSKAGFSESLIAQLRLDEQRVADIKGKLAERTRERPKTLPHPRIIEGYLRNVLAILEGDPERTRMVLTGNLEPVIITPMADGRWQLSGALNLTAILSDSARSSAGRVTENESSGGVI